MSTSRDQTQAIDRELALRNLGVRDRVAWERGYKLQVFSLDTFLPLDRPRGAFKGKVHSGVSG